MPHPGYAPFIREKIELGWDDIKIWKAMVRKWPDIDESKISYIPWYRRHARRAAINDNAKGRKRAA